MKRVLVTGGAGFIGSRLVRRLLADECAVTVLDDFSTGRRMNLPANYPNFSVVDGTVTDERTVDKLVSRVDTVFHLAAVVGVMRVVENPHDTLVTNIVGTRNVLDSCERHKKRVVLASSSEVYGKQTGVLSETTESVLGPSTSLRWTYAMSKLVDELDALSRPKLSFNCVRYFNVTGGGQLPDYGMVLPRFVRSALNGEPLYVSGSGNQSRCFTHVDDAVTATVLADLTSRTGQIYNVGNPHNSTTILELARRVVRLVDPSCPIRIQGYEEMYGKGFEDIESRVPDVSKARNELGFEAKRSLDEIVADAISWGKL